jgi:alpha-1,2-mannosyltransferase
VSRAVAAEAVREPGRLTPSRARIVYVLGIAPLVALAVVSIVTFVDGLNPGSIGFDFRGAFLPAAEAVLDGESPYPPVEGPELASQTAYVYPPLLAYLVAPFTLLPETAASIVAVLGVAALLAGTLVVLGVRDVRCYAAMLLWAPTTNALHMASSSAVLAFAAALAWRYRATTWPLAASVGLGVGTKLILWPLLVWTAATRRLRPTVYAVVAGGGVTLVAWAALGFQGFERYPAMLRRLAALEAEESYSLVGAAAALGVGDAAARVAALLIGSALVIGVVVFARRGDDFRSFTLALAAALAFTPIVWLHYLVLLLVPLAIARPRFSAVWLLPLLLWLTPLNGNGESIQPLLPAFVAAIVIVLALVEPERDPEPTTALPAVAR